MVLFSENQLEVSFVSCCLEETLHEEADHAPVVDYTYAQQLGDLTTQCEVCGPVLELYQIMRRSSKKVSACICQCCRCLYPKIVTPHTLP